MRTTQLGLLRLLTSAGPMRGQPLPNEQAWAVWDGFLSDDRVQVFPELPALEERFRAVSSGPQPSPKIWVDAYLAAQEATLVTFDHAFAAYGVDWLHPVMSALYAKALEEFFPWREGSPPFARATVQAYRVWLEEQGVKQAGVRAGNWLSREQAAALLQAPDPATRKGWRDRALLAVLIGCALRRAELVALTLDHLQQRDR